MNKPSILNLKQLLDKKVFLLGLTLFAAFFVLVPVVATLKSQPNEIEIDYLFGHDDPVKIVSVKVGNTSIVSGKKTVVSGDLIKDFRATIQNKQSKTINYVQLQIIVVRPDDQKDVPPFIYTVFLGNRKKALKKEKSGLEISPDSNNKADLSLSAYEYDEVRASLNRLGYPLKTEKLLVQLDEVAFSDGTIWSIGSYYRTDPNDEKQKLIPLSFNNLENKSGAFINAAFSL